jgi:hypothetical protein
MNHIQLKKSLDHMMRIPEYGQTEKKIHLSGFLEKEDHEKILD